MRTSIVLEYLDRCGDVLGKQFHSKVWPAGLGWVGYPDMIFIFIIIKESLHSGKICVLPQVQQ